MKASAVERKTCRLCGSAMLEKVMSLVPTPLGDDFIPACRPIKVQECFPLELMLCRSCGNVQLLHVVDPETVCPEHTYRSSISLELPEHFQRYANDLIQRVPLSEESLVVDIGSHEKMLLRSFKDKARILGIDPDPGIARQAYFTSELAESVRKEKGYASVVIANYIFANIDDLDDVATGIRSLLAPDGIFVLETSYLLDVLEKALLDTIFHEHVSYFAVKPLESFFQRHGLKLFDVERVSMKGGSIRCFFQLAGGPFKRNGSVSKMIEGESKACIYNKEAFRRLSDKLEDLRVQLNEMLDSLTEQKKTVACYGTAVGITTMLYYFGIAEKISFIIDDNPAKQNTSSPGFHLPVFSSEAIYEKKPDYIFVGAWRYFEKIKTKHVEYLDRGGHFILPLPQLEII